MKRETLDGISRCLLWFMLFYLSIEFYALKKKQRLDNIETMKLISTLAQGVSTLSDLLPQKTRNNDDGTMHITISGESGN